MGSDAGSFLQGQLTNDIQQVGVNSTYGLWLNQKGRVLADSQVLRLSEVEFLVVSIFSSGAVIRQRLEQFIIADEVELADETEKFGGLVLWGPESGERMKDFFGEIPERGIMCRADEILAYAGSRLKGKSYEILGPAPKVAELRKRLLESGCGEVFADEMELARISAGIPLVPQDIGPGDLPQEGGLDQVAISYTKGCYLGQEVMARLKNMGQVRRKLYVVRGRGEPPQPAAAVFQNGRKVGELRSVAGDGAGFVALAMLVLLNLDLDAGVGRGADEPGTIRIIPHE